MRYVLSELQVMAIRRAKQKGLEIDERLKKYSYKAIGERYGVCEKTVMNVVSGRHGGDLRSSVYKRIKLQAQINKDLREKRKQYTCRHLAKVYNKNAATIERIFRGETFKDIK